MPSHLNYEAKPRAATLAPSAAPLNHLKVWTDGRTLFVEVPGAVITYPLSDGGLSKALSLICATRYDFGGTPQKSTSKGPRTATLQSARAEALLRIRGIIR